MGELSKRDAEKKQDAYIRHLSKLKERVREEFIEMDFENADKRDEMERKVERLESEYKELISKLESMSFEGGTE